MLSSDEHRTLADAFAEEAAAFVAAVESVAAGDNPGEAVSVLILSLSGILASGAGIGVQQDFGPLDEVRQRALEEPQAEPIAALRSSLEEALGSLDEYREVLDPYLGDEIAVTRLSHELAAVSDDLLVGLGAYTEDDPLGALCWWQYSYLASWGAGASSCLRAMQSLLSLVRLGTPLGAPGDDQFSCN